MTTNLSSHPRWASIRCMKQVRVAFNTVVEIAGLCAFNHRNSDGKGDPVISRLHITDTAKSF